MCNLCLAAGRRLNITAENDCRRLHCSLRDLSSLLQAVGRLAEYFIGDVFAARFSDALAVVERSDSALVLFNTQSGLNPNAKHIQTEVLLASAWGRLHTEDLEILQSLQIGIKQVCKI